MKKIIIASLVSGIIFLVWQTLSWTKLGIHTPNFKYTDKQDQILEAMVGLDHGSYFVPNLPPTATAAEQSAGQEKVMGQPWAVINYRKSFDFNLPMNLGKGLIVNIIAAFFLCWVLMKIPDIDFNTALLAALAIGMSGYLVNVFTNQIWFENNTLPELIDTIAQWGLAGLWLGFYLSKK